MKRKLEQNKFNPKKTKYIDIIYSQFDSDSDSEDDPEWLPPGSESDLRLNISFFLSSAYFIVDEFGIWHTFAAFAIL